MNRLVSSLLLSLTLLTAACKKEEKPKPAEAPLEGTWQWQRATDTYYNADNKLISSTAHSSQPGSFTLIITGQTIQDRNNSSQYTATTPYIRQGDTLLYTNYNLRRIIKELSAHTLIIYTKGQYSPPGAGSFGGRTDTEVYYTR